MKAFPKPLTAEEEACCLERCQNGDEEARRLLIEHNLRLVAHVARKYQGCEEDPDDLISIGTIGLIKAVSTFDSKKNSRIITVGDIQVMSAGTGIFHSEINGSTTEPVEFLQIWIMPRERNTHPAYNDYSIRELERKNELVPIVSPDGSTPASLLQDTWFSIGKVETGKKLGYHMHQTHGGVYIFLIEGEIVVDGTVLKRRDGMGVYETNSFEIETLKDSHILLIEVPM